MDGQPPDAGPSDDYSFRSRASSIVSTGTKTSLAPTFLTTPFNPQSLPPPAPTPPASSPSTVTSGVIDVLLGRRNFRISARPGSILSISSFDVPAPPYSEALNTPAIPIEQYAPLAHRSRENATRTDWQGPNLELPPRPRVQIRPSTAEHESSASENETQASNSYDDEDGTRTASPPSPPLSPFESSQNALSAHYTNVVRTIDSNHRAEVARLEANHQAQMTALSSAHAAELDNELDALRSELETEHTNALAATRNDIDGVYRGEFARMRQEAHELGAAKELTEQLMDQVTVKVVELDRRIKGLEAEAEQAEKEKARLKEEADERERMARNEVEDVWERRWKDRMNLAAEQVMKADREFRVWKEEVEKRWPEAAEEVRETVEELIRGEEEARKGKKGKKWPSF